MQTSVKAILGGALLLIAQAPLLALVLSQEHTWGGPEVDEATAVAVAPDNSVYVAGTTLSFGVGDRDAFLLKYDASGALLWQRTFGTAPSEPFFRADEFGQAIGVAPDGGSVYITGQFGNGSVFVAKFSAGGDLLWQRTWGDNGNFANGLAVSPDGSVYVAGGTSTYDVGQSDTFLFKLTADGLLEWDMTWGGFGFDAARDLAADAAGNVYMAGETNSFVANDAFLIKVSPAGTVLWERDWGAFNRDGFPGLTAAYGVGTAADGSVYITGNVFDTGAENNVILVKFTANGDLVWQRVGGPGAGAGLDVAVAADGQVFVTGNMLVESREFPDSFGGHAFVAQFSADGKKGKALAWGGATHESANGESIAIAPDGAIAVAGSVQSPPYVSSATGNSARRVDAFTEPMVGIVTDPVAPLNDAPGGAVTAPEGSTTFGGQIDAAYLRIAR